MHTIIKVSRHQWEAIQTLDDAWNKGWEFIGWHQVPDHNPSPEWRQPTDGWAIMRKRFQSAERLKGT